MHKRIQRNNSGFTIIEVLATIVILAILLGTFILVFKKGIEKSDGNITCVEWEDVQVSDCWSYGYGTSCEHRTEKRCVRYEYNDGGTKTE